ncbi:MULTISPECIES: metalloregulator ArsR/SmtB family transcription factor [unclassified Roseitalea]|uniref:ArsR/SmtB family transcription factor n=1 Tax=unclassified Roseitalea TaxID=2639107 RepID=UPI00273FE112|nr:MULTISPECIES: metalloregulator ArsR/SmtB family transcription factor [unclassified Roseitalea]
MTRDLIVTYAGAVDAIFKALADDTRRKLLDMLRRKDGQTLSELERQLGMSRFGVMKHLKVLEEASLVVTRRSGRFKHHYLNAVPLQQVIDRWIEPLVQKPMARMALDLKAELEGDRPMTTATQTKPDFVLETFIRTTPEALWDALTSGEKTPHFYIAGARLNTELKKGGRFDYHGPDGSLMLGGEIVSIEPMSRIEMTFEPVWGEDRRASRYVYEIEPQGETCKFTIVHYDLPADQDGVREGWARIASGLKTYLETGEPSPFVQAA